MALLFLKSPLAAQVDADSVIAELETAAEELVAIEPADAAERHARVTWTASARWPLELRDGFHRSDSTSFLGPPGSFRSRLKLRIGEHLHADVVVDKDSGEPFGASYRPFDLQGGSVSLRKIGPVNEVVVGAIRPRFGLGLVTWAGPRLTRLGASVSSAGSPRSSVNANTSMDEAMRMHGAAFDVCVLSRLSVTGFAARMHQDAVVDGGGVVTSLPVNGLHRSQLEIERKNRLRGSVAGASAVLGFPKFALGVSTVTAAMEDSMPAPTRAYQFHRFSGNVWTASSVFWRISGLAGLVLSGEIALDDDRTPAVLIVGRAKVRQGVDVFGAWRDYPASFNTVLGSPPGATSSGRNERGVLLAARFRTAWGRLLLERDVFRRPWLQATAYGPTITNTWRIEFEHEAPRLRIALRFNTRRERASVFQWLDESSRRYRVRVVFDVAQNLWATADLVVVRRIEGDRSAGNAVGQSFEWMPSSPFRFRAGVVMFSTDSGKSSVYLYEPDVEGYLTVANLTGRGQRVYVLLNLSLLDTLSVWFKGAVTRFARVRTLGSGADRLTTDLQRSLSVAVRIRR